MRLQPLLRVAAALLVALAAASPYMVTYKPVELRLENVESVAKDMPVQHIILLDVSRSMGYTDGSLGGLKRIDAAKRFLREYLEALGNDRVVVTAFSGNLSSICTGVEECLEEIGGVEAVQRFSAIGDALVAASLRASLSGAPSIILLVSDGAWNSGSDPRRIAEELGNETPVIFVEVGSDPRASIVEEAARIGGYKVYRLDEFSLDAVRDMVREVRREARYRALKAAGIAEVKVPVRSYTLSSWVGVAALIVLLGSLRGGP